MLKDWLGLIGQKQNDEQYEEEFLEKLVNCSCEQLNKMFFLEKNDNSLVFREANDKEEFIIVSRRVRSMGALVNAHFENFEKTLGSNNYDELFEIADKLCKAFKVSRDDNIKR